MLGSAFRGLTAMNVVILLFLHLLENSEIVLGCEQLPVEHCCLKLLVFRVSGVF